MSLIKYSPFFKMKEFDQAFADMFSNELRGTNLAAPKIDMLETGDEVKVEVECAGMNPEDLDITVENRTLTISGEKRGSSEQSHGKFIRTERSYGKFIRTVAIPENLDCDAATAKAENGVITISIPKVEKETVKKLKIEVTPETPKALGATN